jgi:hypothetical protein
MKAHQFRRKQIGFDGKRQPRITARRTQSSTFKQKRQTCFSVGSAGRLIAGYASTPKMTAKMAPVWMAISNTLALRDRQTQQ